VRPRDVVKAADNLLAAMRMTLGHGGQSIQFAIEGLELCHPHNVPGRTERGSDVVVFGSVHHFASMKTMGASVSARDALTA